MRLMKRVLRVVALAVALLFVGIQFVRTESVVNKPFDETRAIEAHARLTPEVAAILKRSCMDCHSQKTEWPWYSHVAPVSWFVAEHVNDGRSDLNFSDWASYDRDEAEHLLTNICKLSKRGAMPLSSYTLIHRDAKLSPADVSALCNWTQSELQRLAAVRTASKGQ